MSIMAKTPSGYKKIGSAYLGERPVDKVFNANGDVVYALQRELTGVPPLLFKGKEQSELLNYRIYGDTVDGNGVGDLVESGEHTGEYKVPVTVEGKNLLQNTATSRTKTGVTFTVNSDGSVTCNGTANDITWFDINRSFDIYAPDGRIVSIGNQGSLNTFYLNIGHVGNVISSHVYSNNTHANAFVHIVIASGYTCDNLTLYPMIRKADIEDDTYEPYHAPVTTPIYLPEQIKKVGDEAEYIDYAEQKQHRVRKNLLQNTATNRTLNGVTFTINEDDSVTCNGTASGTVDFRLVGFNSYSLPAGNYCLTGAPPTARHSSYYLRAWYSSSGSTVGINEFGSGTNFTLTDTTILLCAIVVGPQQVLNNVTFYPMIRKADIEDDTYEPYIENTDLDVTLPALPVLPGTNTMSIDTEVQPSRMDIKGRIKTTT